MGVGPGFNTLIRSPLALDVIQQFGAAADGVTDDFIAIETAIAQAIVLGVPAYFGAVNPKGNPSVFATGREIPINGVCTLLGDSASGAVSTIKAIAPMRSVLAWRSTFGTPQPESSAASRGQIARLVVDANLQADNALLLLGTQMSRVDGCTFKNARKAGIRNALLTNTPTLGTVTTSSLAGSPAGVTFSVLDPNYLGGVSLQAAGTVQVAVQCVIGGALDVATFKTSFNGGSTFQTLTQPISAKANLAVDDGGGHVACMTGLQAQFPAGTYAPGAQWTVPVTITNGDYAQAIAANAVMRYEDVTTQTNGQVYSTLAVAGRYSGGFNFTQVVGTVATTAGNARIVGTGTAFTSMLGGGFTRGLIRLGNGSGTTDAAANTYQIAGVLSDTVLEVIRATEPAASVSGLDYACGFLGGLYEDGQTEADDALIIGGHTNQDAIGISVACQHGCTLIAREISGAALAGISFGGTSIDPGTRNAMLSVQVDSQALLGMFFAPSSTGSWLEPHHGNTSYGGRALGWTTHLNGARSALVDGGQQDFLQASSLSFEAVPLTMSSAAQVIPAPDDIVFNNAGHSCFVLLNPTGNFTLSGTPCVADPGRAGVLYVLVNVNASNTITIPFDTGPGGSGMGATANVVLGPGQMALLFSLGSRPSHPPWVAMARSV